jgi:hypothetical protein
MIHPAEKSSERILTAPRIHMRYGPDPRSGLRLSNALTGAEFCRNGIASVLVRFPDSVSDPVLASELVGANSSLGHLTYALSDKDRRVHVAVTISPGEDGLRFDAEVQADKPIWNVEWTLSGLACQSILIPGLGGQELTSGMPEGMTLTYKYPFWWNAQFVIGTLEEGGVWLRTKDPSPTLRLVRTGKRQDGFALTYGWEADGPLTSRSLRGAWFLDCFSGSWEQPVDLHRAWMASAFSLKGLADNPRFPAWARDIDFVLELWGMRKDTAEPHHTFEQMRHRLEEWTEMHDPRKTLVYLPGFAEHGIDSRTPSYLPSPHLGGDAGFRELMDLAHQRDFHVMIHTNVLGMTYDHPMFEAYREHQVVDVFGRPQSWGLDLDGDWLPEPYFAYINPGVEEWGALMTSLLGEVITRYGVDAVFLDQTLVAFNVSRGPNFVAGMAAHIARLQNAFPGVLFAGEGLHEQVLSGLPMAQIHGIDSIAEVHGMDAAEPWRKAHPVSTHLFHPFTRFTGHLLTKHPSHPMFAVQEAAYGELGVIPALCLYDHRQPMEMPAVHDMLRRASALRFHCSMNGAGE